MDNNAILVYDPETNSYQWASNVTTTTIGNDRNNETEDGDAACSICLENYGAWCVWRAYVCLLAIFCISTILLLLCIHSSNQQTSALEVCVLSYTFCKSSSHLFRDDDLLTLVILQQSRVT